jgi:hypothetical protein
MSHDEPEALESFIARLNRVRRTAGQPSYAKLEQLSGQLAHGNRAREVKLIVLTRSTTQQILTGGRRGAPTWPWVLSYVTALQAAARAAGIPPESIGSIGEWKKWHEAAGERPGCADDDLRGEFFGLIRRAGAPQWWHGYGDAAPEWLAFYMYLESIAMRIRMYAPGHIPCLLQTAEYAQAAVSRCQPKASPYELGRQVELRLRRQQRLRGRSACELWAVVEESALRDPQMRRKTMRTQLRRLIEAADQPNVAISVLLSDAGDDAMIREPVSIFRFAERHLGDVVCLEQQDDALFLHKRADTLHYSQLIDILAIRASAKSREAQDLLWRILRET